MNDEKCESYPNDFDCHTTCDNCDLAPVRRAALEFSEEFEAWLEKQPLRENLENLLGAIEGLIDSYREGSLDQVEVNILDTEYTRLINSKP